MRVRVVSDSAGQSRAAQHAAPSFGDESDRVHDLEEPPVELPLVHEDPLVARLSEPAPSISGSPAPWNGSPSKAAGASRNRLAPGLVKSGSQTSRSGSARRPPAGRRAGATLTAPALWPTPNTSRPAIGAGGAGSVQQGEWQHVSWRTLCATPCASPCLPQAFSPLCPAFPRRRSSTLSEPEPGISLFAASDDEAGLEVWRSDGTSAGTYRLTDDACAEYCEHFNYFFAPWVEAGNRAFVYAQDNEVTTLWVTDGSRAGTFPVYEGNHQPDRTVRQTIGIGDRTQPELLREADLGVLVAVEVEEHLDACADAPDVRALRRLGVPSFPAVGSQVGGRG